MTNNDTSISDSNTRKKAPHITVSPSCKGLSKYKYKLYTFVIIALLQLFVNYDNGVITVSLNWIQEPYNFSSTELGIVGSLPYFAYVAMSPFMSYLFLAFGTQPVITIALTINILSLVIYALAVNKYMFFISKFCIGASQSLFTTYYPIWVDTFAPEFHRNLWMSILQGGIVIGMTLGYVVTSVFSFTGNRGWRYSTLTQILYGLVLTILFYLVPKEFINFDPSRDEHVDFDLCTCEKLSCNTMEINSNKGVCLTSYSDNLSIGKDADQKRYRSLDIITKASSLGMSNSDLISRIHSSFEGSASRPEYSKCSKCFVNNVKLYRETMRIKKLSPWSKFKMLIKENIFILNCISMSIISLSSSGFLFWMTKIYVDHLKMNEKAVYFIFSLQVLTGMLFGTISGSHTIDQIIYHYPQRPLLVDTTLIVYCLICCLFDVVVVVFQIPMVYGACFFILIFYTSSMVPTVMLQSVEYLPHRLKPAGSSFFICQYHIFGFALGAIIPGIAIDIFNNYTAALCVIHLQGFVLLCCYITILFIKWHRIKKAKITGRSIYIKGVVVI
ncbi:Major Facilitator Superfamily protein [Theileria parva strain Muguga]|uniref:Major facilitator superfamily (MFS) profile domain-containing protein n=1 Tax=Theileria parva TaxID=5875 RepID=Q4N015_THEPA|nr:Major Facilitator Superfamily protein [Theileria parva strain Muguga]EAN31074.1 Major Facilitator Superfamily protein [Theileria parva strain Muguga]|eukprot:XP_763357.1 hypothetical protein [Theileria parva strain Muguga]